MSKIYKITNDINNKVYIGKTEYTVEKRFNEHCQDAFKTEENNRPLYRAMKKYGINHFHIEEIESCLVTEAALREQYWIEYYNSYQDGYNATRGGDGKSYIDINELVQLWNEGKGVQEIAKITGHDSGHVSQLLKNNGVTEQDIKKRSKEPISKRVVMLDKNGKVLQIFSSTREAARYLVVAKQKSPTSEGGYATHISEVCRGIRKSCLGYKWQYFDNE